MVMRWITASLTVACLGVTAVVGSCTRPDCVTQRQVATARGEVTECVTAEDARATGDLQKRLGDELADAAGTIHVSASGGVVTLTGEVRDEWHRNRAEKLAYATDAVERVENKLIVIQPPQNPRALPPGDATDVGTD